MLLDLIVIILLLLQKCVNAGRSDCPSAVDVFVQTPFYPGYPSLIEYISTANWNPQANTSSEFTMEIVTLVTLQTYSNFYALYRHPNNPDGEPRKPLVKDSSHVIYDMVYYWPMFTNVSVKMSEVSVLCQCICVCMRLCACRHVCVCGNKSN